MIPGNHHLKVKMNKTSFRFPVVLLVVAAGYLLSAALWAAEGPGGTASSPPEKRSDYSRFPRLSRPESGREVRDDVGHGVREAV